jgi:hypothetical protein
MKIRYFGTVVAVLCGFVLACTLVCPFAKASTTSNKKSSPSSSAGTSKKSSSKRSSSSRRKKRSKKSASWRRGQQRIDSDRSREIQEALIREHYLQGKPTGTWDAASQRAMVKFQSDNGWQTKIVPDSRALIKLGLGPNHDHLLNPESAMTGPIPTRGAKAQADPPASSPITPVSTGPAAAGQPQQ